MNCTWTYLDTWGAWWLARLQPTVFNSHTSMKQSLVVRASAGVAVWNGKCVNWTKASCWNATMEKPILDTGRDGALFKVWIFAVVFFFPLLVVRSSHDTPILQKDNWFYCARKGGKVSLKTGDGESRKHWEESIRIKNRVHPHSTGLSSQAFDATQARHIISHSGHGQ